VNWSLLLGFIGGLAAVGLKGAVDLFFEHRRDKKAARAAARLMMEELARGFRYCNQLAQWDGNPHYPFDKPWPLEVWRDHASLLATTLDPFDWARVATAYRTIEATEIDHGPLRRLTPLDELSRTELKRRAAWISEGLDVLVRIAGGPPNLRRELPERP
jgi:hypothetical protein